MQIDRSSLEDMIISDLRVVSWEVRDGHKDGPLFTYALGRLSALRELYLRCGYNTPEIVSELNTWLGSMAP